MDITITGTIAADGALHLHGPPNMPPGLVEVTLRSVQAVVCHDYERLPDTPCFDESVSPPFDLPRPVGHRIFVRQGGVRLPEAIPDDFEP